MRIGVLAASSRANPETIPAITAYAARGFPEVELVFHPQCVTTDGHFAGSDFARAEAFVQFANDPALDAIWFLRGGYGSNRILQMAMPELGRAACASYAPARRTTRRCADRSCSATRDESPSSD